MSPSLSDCSRLLLVHIVGCDEGGGLKTKPKTKQGRRTSKLTVGAAAEHRTSELNLAEPDSSGLKLERSKITYIYLVYVLSRPTAAGSFFRSDHVTRSSHSAHRREGACLRTLHKEDFY